MAESISVTLADQLLQMAIDGNMKTGDKLPGEIELAEKFQVSRVSIREAINGLKFLGILDAAPRRGTTIAALDYRRLVKYIGFQMAFSSMSEAELFEARLALETGMLELVAKRMTDETWAELRELAEACRRASDEPEAVAASIEADMRFHRRLLELSGNGMLQAFVKLIEVFFLSSNRPPANRQDQENAAEVHLMIVEALHDRNVELARGLMQKHLAKHRF
ncbi:MAG: hypothetical protein DBX90_11655 [Lentisphaerae bacterium]|nr:MAG: hypothetical protein DBX90_11655 [Lentisphaerota bacterium]